MNDSAGPPKVFLVDTVTTEGLFGLFSIFFVSTVSLFFAIVITIPQYQTYKFQQSLFFITISIFLIGYMIVLASILIYYIIRFSKSLNIIYQNHKSGFVSVILLAILIIPTVIASILAMSEDFTNKAIAYTVLPIMTVIIVMMQNVLIKMAEPYTSKISRIISTHNPEPTLGVDPEKEAQNEEK